MRRLWIFGLFLTKTAWACLPQRRFDIRPCYSATLGGLSFSLLLQNDSLPFSPLSGHFLWPEIQSFLPRYPPYSSTLSGLSFPISFHNDNSDFALAIRLPRWSKFLHFPPNLRVGLRLHYSVVEISWPPSTMIACNSASLFGYFR